MTGHDVPGHDVDVVVVGTGSIGSMALWQLSQVPGLRVAGIDRFGAGHPHGSFTGESRLYRAAYKEGAIFVPLLLDARRRWIDLEAESGREIFLRTGTLSIGPADSDVMRTTLQTIADFDLPHRVLDAAAMRTEHPQHAVGDDDVAVLDELGGALRSELAVLSALEAARRRGADLHLNSPVLAVEENTDGVLVRTAHRTIRAARAVVTGGSWAGQLVPAVREHVRIMPLALTWFVPRDLDAFRPERFPTFMRDVGDVHFFGSPTLDGFSVKVSPGLTWDPVDDVADLPTAIPREQLVVLGQQAQAFFPDLHPEPVRVGVHHDGWTEDRFPVIDTSTGGRVVVACGFSGHGFKLAPAYGRLAADLVTTGTSELHRTEFTLADHRRRRRVRRATELQESP